MYKNQLNCNDFENNADDYFTIEFKPLKIFTCCFFYTELHNVSYVIQGGGINE